MNFEFKCLNELKKRHQKIFIIIGGASASGKNYHAELLNFPILDVDEINKQLNNGQVNCRKTVGKALSIVKQKIKENFESGLSFIQTTTASTLPGTRNKFKLAKKYEYFTVLINIETSLDQAIKNNEFRVANGGHGATIPKWKILATKVGADYVFNELRGSKYVDLTIKIKNIGFKINEYC